jgi:hypothetical protein
MTFTRGEPCSAEMSFEMLVLQAGGLHHIAWRAW